MVLYTLFQVHIHLYLLTKLHIGSYIIQHFQDTFRQCIIDLIHGNLHHYNDLQHDDVLITILSITKSSGDVPDVYDYGILNAELKLIESLIVSSRFARCELCRLNFFFHSIPIAS